VRRAANLTLDDGVLQVDGVGNDTEIAVVLVLVLVLVLVVVVVVVAGVDVAIDDVSAEVAS
jgi:hypothetical protein